MRFDQPINWRRLYGAAAIASAAMGVLVVLGLLPAIPPQVTAWIQSVNETVALLVAIVGGALMGLALAAVAHLGVVWQLRHRSKSPTG